jgi:hypothetical protein
LTIRAKQRNSKAVNVIKTAKGMKKLKAVNVAKTAKAMRKLEAIKATYQPRIIAFLGDK